MKWMTWTLLAANLLVAGFFIGRAYLPQTGSNETAPMNVDRLSLRSQAGSAASDETPKAAEAPRAFCVEWRGLNQNEFTQLREQFKTMANERVMSFTAAPVNTRHWVIFPPLPSAESAEAKLGELAAAGIQDAFVVKDMPWRNAISLGLYANSESAQRRVREVEEKGVLGTRVEVQPKRGTDYYFVIRSEDPDALKSLGEIGQAYPNSRQSRVACPS
ncbi:MAG: hypothetical protein B7X93_06990 [Hydrogenophilales bacterium 17-61-9]|nr:MAG: hypothetical protein B7X93_06990 [Hydrogenophilales bacterium 17-61-9]